MCLTKVTKTYPGRGIGPIIAYKKFKVIGGVIFNFVRSGGKPWKVNEEQSAGPKSKIRGSMGRFYYSTGFHAYIRKNRSWIGDTGVWAKVRLRGVQTRGYQNGRPALVARYCKILEILDK